MKKTLTCISCPLGCMLTAVEDETGGAIVSGNRCSRGAVYAREEFLAPKRVVTATVGLRQSAMQRIPVKTHGPLDRALIPELLTLLYGMELAPPIHSGEILIRDFRGSGVDVVATRSCEAMARVS